MAGGCCKKLSLSEASPSPSISEARITALALRGGRALSSAVGGGNGRRLIGGSVPSSAVDRVEGLGVVAGMT